jgi:hypothetical protein
MGKLLIDAAQMRLLIMGLDSFPVYKGVEFKTHDIPT